MKEMMRRFGVVMVLGALLGGVVMAGCGGGEEEEEPAANATKPADDAGDE